MALQLHLPGRNEPWPLPDYLSAERFKAAWEEAKAKNELMRLEGTTMTPMGVTRIVEVILYPALVGWYALSERA